MADYLRDAVAVLKAITKELEGIHRELIEIRRQMPKPVSATIEVSVPEIEDDTLAYGIRSAFIQRIDKDENIRS